MKKSHQTNPPHLHMRSARGEAKTRLIADTSSLLSLSWIRMLLQSIIVTLTNSFVIINDDPQHFHRQHVLVGLFGIVIR